MMAGLLVPEAQADAYTWAAVLVAHAGIGAALRVVLAGLIRSAWTAVVLAPATYAAFETVQAAASGRSLIWDSLLDWSAVTRGAALAAGLYRGSLRTARAVVLAVGMIAAAGAWVRRGRG